MKRKMKILFGVIPFVSLLACCTEDNIVLGISDAEAQKAVINDILVCEDEHLATNTLHQGYDNLVYSTIPFIENGVSSYKIVVDKSSDLVFKAGNDLRAKIYDKFGYYMEIIDQNDVQNVNADDKYVIFSTSKYTEYLPSIDLIDDFGYIIKTVNNSLYVLAHSDKGISNAYRALMKILLGYELLFDLEIYEINGVTIKPSSTLYLPICNIIEKPDFKYRCRGQTLSNQQIADMGLTLLNKCFYTIGNGSGHNSLQILPYNKYGTSHSKWYEDKTHKQLCYTAHGDKSEYEALLSTLANIFVELYNKDPLNNNSFFVGQMDKAGTNLDANLCECEACKNVMKNYSTSRSGQKPFSAVFIKFFNDLDDWIQTKYDIHNIKLVFFAYQDSMYSPIDPNKLLHTNNNVSVMVAPSRASYTHSFYDPMQENMEHNYPQICRDWSNCTDSIYMYYYEVQFKSVLYPFQTFTTTIDNCRFAHEVGSTLIYPEGDEFNTNMTSFGRFKDYLYTRGSENVNHSYQQLKSFFFSHYYGAAGEIMENMYDQIIAYLTYLGSKQPGVYKGLITEPGYDNVMFWNQSLLEQWEQMVNQALLVLETNKNFDTDNYEKYKSHIEIEGVFPLFALCQLYRSQMNNIVFAEKATKVANYCREYNIQYKSEADHASKKSLYDTLFKDWGV